MLDMLSIASSHHFFGNYNEDPALLETEETFIEKRRELLKAQKEYYKAFDSEERARLEEKINTLDTEIKQLTKTLYR